MGPIPPDTDVKARPFPWLRKRQLLSSFYIPAVPAYGGRVLNVRIARRFVGVNSGAVAGISMSKGTRLEETAASEIEPLRPF
jgi:hypothetical protein